VGGGASEKFAQNRKNAPLHRTDGAEKWTKKLIEKTERLVQGGGGGHGRSKQRERGSDHGLYDSKSG